MKSILLVLLTLSHIVFTQDLDCQKFRTGNFLNVDDKNGNTIIKRTEKYQFETKSSGIRIKLKITWIDDCTYRLSFIRGRAPWKKKHRRAGNPAVIVKIVETGEDYYIQVSKFEGVDDFEYRSKIEILK